jgi:hypothetical protein
MRHLAAPVLAAGLMLVGPELASADVLLAGVDDSFDGVPEPAIPGPELARVLSAFRGTQDFDLIPNVDGGKANRQIAHTMFGIPETVVSATLELRARAGETSGTSSDGVFLSFTAPEHETFADAIVYRRSFGPMSAKEPYYPDDDPGLLTQWQPGDQANITLDLAALPLPDGTTLNLLPELTTFGFLDVTVSDDTGADYYRLSYTMSVVGVSLADLAENRLSAAPNPFRSETTIGFALPARGDVAIKIFEVSGRAVRTYRRAGIASGEHTITWDGRDDAGRDVGSGVFFYRLETADYAKTKQLVRLR